MYCALAMSGMSTPTRAAAHFVSSEQSNAFGVGSLGAALAPQMYGLPARDTAVERKLRATDWPPTAVAPPRAVAPPAVNCESCETIPARPFAPASALGAVPTVSALVCASSAAKSELCAAVSAGVAFSGAPAPAACVRL